MYPANTLPTFFITRLNDFQTSKRSSVQFARRYKKATTSDAKNIPYNCSSTLKAQCFRCSGCTVALDNPDPDTIAFYPHGHTHPHFDTLWILATHATHIRHTREAVAFWSELFNFFFEERSLCASTKSFALWLLVGTFWSDGDVMRNDFWTLTQIWIWNHKVWFEFVRYWNSEMWLHSFLGGINHRTFSECKISYNNSPSSKLTSYNTSFVDPTVEPIVLKEIHQTAHPSLDG